MKLKINLKDVVVYDDALIQLPAGAYAVDLVSASPKEKIKGGGVTSCQFNVRVADGPMKGVPQILNCGIEANVDPAQWKLGNKLSWARCFKSFGISEETFQRGELTIDTDQFVGKRAYILVEGAPAGENGQVQTDRSFIPKTAYEQIRAAGVTPAVRPAATAAPAGATAQGGQSFKLAEPAAVAPASSTPPAAAIPAATSGEAITLFDT